MSRAATSTFCQIERQESTLLIKWLTVRFLSGPEILSQSGSRMPEFSYFSNAVDDSLIQKDLIHTSLMSLLLLYCGCSFGCWALSLSTTGLFYFHESAPAGSSCRRQHHCHRVSRMPCQFLESSPISLALWIGDQCIAHRGIWAENHNLRMKGKIDHHVRLNHCQWQGHCPITVRRVVPRCGGNSMSSLPLLGHYFA